MRAKLILLVLTVSIGLSFVINKANYDDDYVQISTVKHRGYEYKVVYMERGASNKRIKAKYFAAKDFNGNLVPDRYKNWALNRDIICVTSGTYMSDCDARYAKPVGLTIDNGILVNKELADFDGLVIVYATGGIVATNLEDKDLTVQGGNISGIKLDIRGNAYQREKFIKWCEEREATVFQTHLLVYKNQIKISSTNSSTAKRERRFLAVGYDDDGQLVHCIVHSPEYTTLYEGTKRVLNFLNEFKEMNVIFMINLDTGCQNIFNLYNSDGSLNSTIEGTTSIDNAANLLVYYYE